MGSRISLKIEVLILECRANNPQTLSSSSSSRVVPALPAAFPNSLELRNSHERLVLCDNDDYGSFP